MSYLAALLERLLAWFDERHTCRLSREIGGDE